MAEQTGISTLQTDALNAFGLTIGVNPAALGVMLPVIEQAARHAASCWDAPRTPATGFAFVADANWPDGLKLILRDPPQGRPHELGFTDWALRQIAGRLGVPGQYAMELVRGRPSPSGKASDARAPHPRAVAALLNQLLMDAGDARKFLLRAQDPVDGKHPARARAFVSDRYRVFDNFDLLGPICRALSEHLGRGGVALDYSGISETNIHIGLTLTDPALRVPVPESEKGGTGRFDRHLFGPGGAKASADGLKDAGGGLIVDARLHGKGGAAPAGVTASGDYYQPCFEIRNSEVGDGGSSLLPGLWRMYCSNRAIVRKYAWQRIHVGDGLDEAARLIVEQDLRAAVVRAIDGVPMLVEAFRKAGDDAEADPTGRLECVAAKADLTDLQRSALIGLFLREPEPTRFGVAQAVTAAAQVQTTAADRARLEELGGAILAMDSREYEMVYRRVAAGQGKAGA